MPHENIALVLVLIASWIRSILRVGFVAVMQLHEKASDVPIARNNDDEGDTAHFGNRRIVAIRMTKYIETILL